MRIPSFATKPLFDLLILSILLALLFGINLGARPYSAPSESRYIEIGREMAESGDFVTPRLNYVKYFEKPPLFYWIQAEWTNFFGLDAGAVRTPTLLFAIAFCLLTYGLARMLYGRIAGWLGALTLATSLYIFALSRIVLLDVPLSFFMAATLTCFLYIANAPEGRPRTWVTYLMYLAAAGAVLTKGLIGIVLPGAVVVIWLACTRRWSLLKNVRLISGIALFLAVAAPWHIMVAMRNPEFLHFYFIHEHFQRYTTREAGRYQPVWFFIAVALAGLFPWVTFISQAKIAAFRHAWAERSQNGNALFLMIWMGFIFLFFSLSDSKLIPYILPIFPPLAAILGGYLASAWQEKKVPGFALGFWTLIVMLLLMAGLPSLLLGSLDANNKIVVALAQGGDELQYLSTACLICAAALLVAYIQGLRRHVIVLMLLVAGVIMQMGDEVGAHYNKDSMQPFAQIWHSVHKPGDEMAMYQVYYQDMPVYVKGRITVVDWKGELEFGMAHEDTSSWMMDPASFWKRWLANDHRMFVVMREDAYARLTKDKAPESLHLNFIQKDGRNMLFLNRSPEEPAKLSPPARSKKS